MYLLLCTWNIFDFLFIASQIFWNIRKSRKHKLFSYFSKSAEVKGKKEKPFGITCQISQNCVNSMVKSIQAELPILNVSALPHTTSASVDRLILVIMLQKNWYTPFKCTSVTKDWKQPCVDWPRKGKCYKPKNTATIH